MDVEIGEKAGHENEIDRAMADHLIGDPHLAALCVSGLRRSHEPICH